MARKVHDGLYGFKRLVGLQWVLVDHIDSRIQEIFNAQLDLETIGRCSPLCEEIMELSGCRSKPVRGIPEVAIGVSVEVSQVPSFAWVRPRAACG